MGIQKPHVIAILLIHERNLCNLRRLIMFKAHMNVDCLTNLKTKACTQTSAADFVNNHSSSRSQTRDYYLQITVEVIRRPDKAPHV